MKLLIKISITILLIILIVLISIQVKRQESNQDKLPDNITLPELNLLSPTDYSLTVIESVGKTIIINCFNTQCDYCQHEIKDIINHMALFKNSLFYLISEQHVDTLRNFITEYSIDSFPLVNVFHLEYSQLNKVFGNIKVPSSFIFDTNGNQIKSYIGQVRAPVMAKEIEEYYLNQ